MSQWWHVFGGELLGGWGLIVAGDSPKPPEEIADNLGPDHPEMRLLASFDHEPTEAEKQALTPLEFQ